MKQCELFWPSMTYGGLIDEQCPNQATKVIDGLRVCTNCANEIAKVS